MSHVTDHCRKPRWRTGRYRHTPWICDCGKAWLSKTVIVMWATGGGLDVTRTVWREWKPTASNQTPRIGTEKRSY